LPGSFPQGRREDIARQRIQIAAEGVNGFGKVMRRQTESQPECETQGDFHPPRRDGRQNRRLPIPSSENSTRPSLFPLALQDEGPHNNTAPATVSLSRSTTEPDVTPRPGSTLLARAVLDKTVSSVRWWPDRLPSTGLRRFAGRRRT